MDGVDMRRWGMEGGCCLWRCAYPHACSVRRFPNPRPRNNGTTQACGRHLDAVEAGAAPEDVEEEQGRAVSAYYHFDSKYVVMG